MFTHLYSCCCVTIVLFIFQVTVFDFSTILERTEKRVRDDLLGAGPKTVEELRSIAGRLRVKYANQLERKIQRAKQKHEKDTKINCISYPRLS